MLLAQTATSPESILANVFMQIARQQPLWLLEHGLTGPGPLYDIYRQVAERRTLRPAREESWASPQPS